MAKDGPAPRDRMVYSAAQLVRERGVTGTGVREVVTRAAAPRGSFQHYFPGGKDQLVGEALRWAGGFAAEHVAGYAATTKAPTPAGLLAHLVAPWEREFSTRGFARGCPVMAAAGDVAAEDSALTDSLRAGLDRWEDAVVAELRRQGFPPDRARALATLLLSTLEGAIQLARIRRDVRPLTTVVTELGPLLTPAPT
ncbi:MAG TPA: TetR/AcrR family transcriptional regulator [Mycobacteriales bacterium]|nr:TetR/AcrR family transcriptional regulator [Mycobacteriales bacterium]